MSAEKVSHISAEERIKVLKRHMLEKVPVGQICEELKISPSVFYRWQTKLFETGQDQLLDKTRDNGRKILEAKVKTLEEKLRQREEALAELMSDHVGLKKRLSGAV